MKRNGAPFLRNGCAVLAEYAGLKVNQVKNSLNFSDDVKKETARKEAEYLNENDILDAVMSGKVDLSKLSPEARQKAELMLKYKQ